MRGFILLFSFTSILCRSFYLKTITRKHNHTTSIILQVTENKPGWPFSRETSGYLLCCLARSPKMGSTRNKNKGGCQVGHSYWVQLYITYDRLCDCSCWAKFNCMSHMTDCAIAFVELNCITVSNELKCRSCIDASKNNPIAPVYNSLTASCVHTMITVAPTPN